MPAHRPRNEIRAWRPAVDGIAEVFHAHFTEHAYPVHTHDTWDLMILDDGSLDFALDRRRHDAVAAGTGTITLLPPGVAHDGRTLTPAGFRKRVLYLDTTVLPARLTGAAVDRPVLGDPLLRHRIHLLHSALSAPGEEFEAESRLALVRERLRDHLRLGSPPAPAAAPAAGRAAHRLAAQLRELLDARTAAGLTLKEAATLLHAHPTPGQRQGQGPQPRQEPVRSGGPPWRGR